MRTIFYRMTSFFRTYNLGSIYFVAILNCLLLLLSYKLSSPWVYPDTETYYDAWNVIKSGSIDVVRTPVYPTFIGLIRELFPTCYWFIIIFLQHLLFISSIRPFYLIAKIVSQNKITAYWTSMTYVLLPLFSSWANLELTEAICVSFAVWTTYFVICLYKYTSFIIFAKLTFFLLLLLFLRPAMLFYLMVIVAVVLYAIAKGKIKPAVFCMLVLVICVGSYVWYVNQIHAKYGIWSPTSVTLSNRYQCGRYVGIITPDGIENKNLKADIARFTNGSKRSVSYADKAKVVKEYNDSLKTKYELHELESFINHQYSKRFIHNIVIIIYHNFFTTLNIPLFDNYFRHKNFCIHWPLNVLGESVLFGWLYVFLFIYIIWILWQIKHKKRLSNSALMLFFIIVLNLFTVLYGAQDEWNRLMLPSMPFFLIILFDLSSRCLNFYVNRHLNCH